MLSDHRSRLSYIEKGERFPSEDLIRQLDRMAGRSLSCLELTTGMANQPRVVAWTALAYTAVTLIGMYLFGRDEWLEHCEAFTVLFGTNKVASIDPNNGRVR